MGQIMAYDLNKILAEYGDNDFGFSAVDEAEYEAVIAEKDETVEEYKQRLAQVEKIIMPFLTNLYKTSNQHTFIGQTVDQYWKHKCKKS